MAVGPQNHPRRRPHGSGRQSNRAKHSSAFTDERRDRGISGGTVPSSGEIPRDINIAQGMPPHPLAREVSGEWVRELVRAAPCRHQRISQWFSASQTFTISIHLKATISFLSKNRLMRSFTTHLSFLRPPPPHRPHQVLIL